MDVHRVRAQAPAPLLDRAADIVGRQQVALGEDDELRQAVEAGAIGGELGAHGLVVGDRISFQRSEVDEMDEHRAALDVGEELVAEAGALGGALDQARDVGEDRLAVLAVDHTERRRERREGVVGDLRRRPGQPAEQRGLAGVRLADQAGVGEQLQPQLDPALLAARPLLGEARSLAGRVGEALVAVPAAAAVGDDGPLARLDEIEQAAVDGHPLGARGHRDLAILPPGAVAIGALTMAPAAGAVMLAAGQRPEVAARGVADQDHVPPVPPVAAVGPAARDMGLAPKTPRPVTTGPGLHPNFRLVVHQQGERSERGSGTSPAS